MLFSQSSTTRSADKLVYNNKDQTITYTGNAIMEDSDSIIKSQIMKFFMKTERARFDGGVTMLNRVHDATISSGVVDYDAKKRYAKAQVKPKLFSRKDNLTITSKVMERDFNTPYATAKDNVKLEHKDIEGEGRLTEAYAENLDYNLDTQIAYLYGGLPTLSQEGNVLFGETLEYNTGTGVADIIGSSVVYVLLNNTNKFGKSYRTNITDTNYNIVIADSIKYESDLGKLYAYGNVSMYYTRENMMLSGQELTYDMKEDYAVVRKSPYAKMPSKKTIVFSDWLEYKRDDKYKDVIFHDNIIMFDYEDDISIEGNQMVIDPDTKIATVKGEPISYMEKRTVRIKANTFQRFDSLEKLRANGSVVINNENIVGRSDWALYFDKTKIIKMLGGNTSVTQDGKTIKAREITYYIETGRTEATGVSGVLE